MRRRPAAPRREWAGSGLLRLQQAQRLQRLIAQRVAPSRRHCGGGVCRERPAVIANLSARVGSIGDNQLGGWYSYRASKAAVGVSSSA